MLGRAAKIRYRVMTLSLLAWGAPLQANPAGFNYGGRLTDAAGKPLAGRVDLEVRFFDDDVAGNQLGTTIPINDVDLVNGVFNIPIALGAAERDTILGTGNPVWIEIKDVTHNKPYPRQSFSAVPYALRVPVDGVTIDFNGSGALEVLPGGLDISGVAQSALSVDGPGANDVTIQAAAGATTPTVLTLPPDGGTSGFVLKTNGSGALYWDNPAAGAGNMDTSVYDNEGAAGQIDLTNGGTGANLSATGGAGQYLKQSSAGGAVTVGTIAAGDIPTGIPKSNVGLGNVDDVSVLSTFTQNDAQYVATDEVRARDAGGLKLFNDAGTAGLFVNDLGDVGIGTSAPGSLLTVGGNPTILNSTTVGIQNYATVTAVETAGALSVQKIGNPASDSAATFIGTSSQAGTAPANANNFTGGLQAVNAGIIHRGSGNVTSTYNLTAASPAITGGGTIGNAYGVYVAPQKAAAVTNGYGIFQYGSSDINHFAGKVGIGVTSPVDMLEVNGRIRATHLCDESGGNCKDLSVASAIGSVTSVGITQPAAGITVSGGPITTSGNMTLALANDLGAVEGLSGNGIARRTGADTWTTLSDTAAGRTLLEAADAAAQRTALGLAIGTNVQAFDATLGGIAATNTTADQLVYSTGVNTFGTTGLSAAARTLLDDATTGDMLTTLGVTNPLNTFTQNAAQRVGTTEVRARDAGGLKLYDDSGAAGLFVEDGGEVGIGTSSPAGILDVVGATAIFGDSATVNTNKDFRLTQRAYDNNKATIAYSYSSATANDITLGGGASGGYAATSLRFNTAANNTTVNGTERMRIDSAGNVGIGTTVPARQLHVHSDTGLAAAIISSAGTGATQQSVLNFVTKGGGTNDFPDAATLGWHMYARGNAYSSVTQRDDFGIAFWNGTVYRNSFYADSLTGNVAIGSNAPNEALEVGGNVRIGRAPASLLTLSGAHTDSVTTITASGSTAGYPTSGTILIGSEAISYTGISGSTFTGCTRGALGTTAASFAGGETINNYLQTIATSATTPKMVVTGSGNVGIGTTAPGVPLDVNGQIDSYDANARIRIAPAAFGANMPGIRTTTNDPLHFGTNDLNRLTISSTGSIGIGIDSPTAKLHVAGTPGTDGIRFPDGTLQTTAAGGSANGPFIISDTKASGTAGGTCTGATWNTRTLNTESDPAGHVTLASNQMTLAAGTYVCRVSAPAYVVGSHKIRLKNVTDDATLLVGQSALANGATVTVSSAEGIGRFTLAASKAVELQHWCQNTRATDGLGIAASSGESEVYATVHCQKE